MPTPYLIMQDASPNDITLKVYNDKFEDYLRQTPSIYGQGHKPLLRWLDFSLSQLNPNSKVFEIGSGHGRDARYIRNKGFDITCSDGAPAFVDYLNRNGLPAIHFNALKDEPQQPYDLFFANAVVPHFTPQDLDVVLTKIHANLTPDGVFAFNAKQGLGDTWINEKFKEKRFVHYWLPEKLKDAVRNAGFEIIFFESNIPGGDLPKHTWIHITARKK